MVGLLLVLDLVALGWLCLRPTPSRLLQNQAQANLDLVLGAGQTRLHVVLEPDGRALCMAVVPSGRAAEVAHLLRSTLGLAAEHGDRLALVEVAPPPPSPWPARGLRLAGSLAALVGAVGLGRLIGWLLAWLRVKGKGAVLKLRDYRARARKAASAPPRPQQVYESVWDRFHQEPLSLQVSRNLLALANPRKGALLEREIAAIRRRLADERGALLPSLPVVEGHLEPSQWRLLVHGACVAQGQLLGPESLVDRAQELGLQLYPELSCRASQWVGLEAVDWLLQQLNKTHPALIQAVLASWTLAEVTQIFRLLLQRGESIRDLVPLLEKMAESPPQSPPEWVDRLVQEGR
jgi:hypothetical protein